uniref:C2H2-type domain-containing protein n=1 Tax=Knipowitschia caucasica TaxID=637954 RepID=A0AAV2KFE6_KNICA
MLGPLPDSSLRMNYLDILGTRNRMHLEEDVFQDKNHQVYPVHLGSIPNLTPWKKVMERKIRSPKSLGRERPYPCVPCGFSFKTKSNLYKHRKSHAHAIKAGLVPFSELAAARAGESDQASPSGEAEVQSDGEQSTDTDEEVEGAMMLMDGPGPQISFEAGKNAGGVEPAYADSAEELSMGAMKVPILIVPKPGAVPSPGMECPPFQDVKTSHHMLGSQAGGRVMLVYLETQSNIQLDHVKAALGSSNLPLNQVISLEATQCQHHHLQTIASHLESEAATL